MATMTLAMRARTADSREASITADVRQQQLTTVRADLGINVLDLIDPALGIEAWLEWSLDGGVVWNPIGGVGFNGDAKNPVTQPYWESGQEWKDVLAGQEGALVRGVLVSKANSAVSVVFEVS